MMKLDINNIFQDQLVADHIAENYTRQVEGAMYSYVMPKPVREPKLLHYSPPIAAVLGLTQANIESKELLEILAGNKIFSGTKPYAMVYGGHQFGHWAGQLGDGRAINLFEVDHAGEHWMLQLKGAGPTPYSRRADGRAVLRSSIREYLCSEAMYNLGVPTTRALSLVLTGDEVERDMLYDGHPAYESGAIVCRVAETFIRFGNFQLFAYRQDIENLKLLTDFTIRNHFSELGEPSKEVYLKFFETVTYRTIDLMVSWERVGFVHGVMNTDNMSILGLTIDYGPYGWLEDYNPGWTPNTTDMREHRYAYGQQAYIGLWNLLQLASALHPLIEDEKALIAIIDKAQLDIAFKRQQMHNQKIGLYEENLAYGLLVEQLLELMYRSQIDMTIFYRNLIELNTEDNQSFLTQLPSMSYVTDFEPYVADWQRWLLNYSYHLKEENTDPATRKDQQRKVNPKYVLRNYMAQLAIDAADQGDYTLIDELYQLMTKPYDDQPDMERYFVLRPDWAKVKVGCSMLSCSS